MKMALALVAGLGWTGFCSASTYELVEVSSGQRNSLKATAVAVGDVDGDGLSDVVLGSAKGLIPKLIHLFLQNPDGTLADPRAFELGNLNNILDIEIGDLDNNGTMDIVAAQVDVLTVLTADGVGGFLRTSVEVPVQTYAINIKLLDIDSDGNLDILAHYLYEEAGSGSLLFGDGKGGIVATTPLAISPHGDLALGDLTGDGRPDLAVVSGSWAPPYAYPHNGTDGFGAGMPYMNDFVYDPDAVAIGDFNGDGWNDTAMSRMEYVWLYPGSSAGMPDASPSSLSIPTLPDVLMGADLDRDGRSDLLVTHHLGISSYIQGEEGLGTSVLTSLPVDYSPLDPPAIAVGDVDDDGCTDVAIASRSYGLILLQGRNCAPVEAANDFNGDGRSDLFWHHAGTGANVIWRGGDYREQQPVMHVTNPSWQVQGHGDFDGDGRADVLWRNVATGAGAIWRSGDFATQQPVTRVTNLDWTIAGIGDFDGDGKDDLLWRNRRSGQNAIWKAGDYRDQQAITTVTDPRWTVVAADDFNGDRKDDILWRHSASGGSAIWRSGDYRDQQPMTGVRNLAWQVAGTGDFNGDDRADILWRNERSGINAIWNSADIDDQSLVADMDDEWVVAAIGDHDGNRNAEIVWRNRVTGENRIWRAMNAALELPVTDVANRAWQLAP